MPQSSFNIWWDYVCPFNDWAEESVDSADDEVLRAELPKKEWLLYLLSKVIGLMENCGSFSHAVASFSDYRDDVESAFRVFGFPRSASLVAECMTLDRDSKLVGRWTDELEERSQLIESRSDWNYETLVSFLKVHDAEMSFSILPFCDRSTEGA
jgi:hypothetical protein